MTSERIIIVLLCAAFVAYIAAKHPSVVPALTLAVAMAALLVGVMQLQ
ncbi:hypothetical protein [Streptomyces sp. NPDC047141]